MNTVREVKSAIRSLSREELLQVHEWLENFLEDQLEMTDEFRARIEQSEREMADGKRPRVLQPI